MDAFSKDLRTTMCEMNDEINLKNNNSSKSGANKNNVSTRITEAILFDYKMLKYFSICYQNSKSALNLPFFLV